MLTAAALIASGVPSVAQPKAIYPYEAANYDASYHELHLYSFRGAPVRIVLPVRLGQVVFSTDGKSIYGTNAPADRSSVGYARGLSKVEFHPTRINAVPGTSQFVIGDFAVSALEDKVVIAGRLVGPSANTCGLFEVSLPSGSLRQVSGSDCRDSWNWAGLSLSPDGRRAVATVNGTLDLIDLAHGSVASLPPEFQSGAWSPDGKWIAVLGDRSHKLVLIDTTDLSRRRTMGHTFGMKPEWFPRFPLFVAVEVLLLAMWLVPRCRTSGNLRETGRKER